MLGFDKDQASDMLDRGEIAMTVFGDVPTRFVHSPLYQDFLVGLLGHRRAHFASLMKAMIASGRDRDNKSGERFGGCAPIRGSITTP